MGWLIVVFALVVFLGYALACISKDADKRWDDIERERQREQMREDRRGNH